jgi:ParB family chromosome partitioning protein
VITCSRHPFPAECPWGGGAENHVQIDLADPNDTIRAVEVIRERLDEDHLLELALVENLQRQDLTPLEEARAYDQLRSALGLSQAEIAGRVGISRSAVANALRLLKLPAEVQLLVEEGSLTGGHARALLAFADDGDKRAWARRAVEAGLSVRDLERAAAEDRQHKNPTSSPARKPTPRDPNIVTAEEQLSLKLGARVQIKTRRRGGAIVITVSDHGDLMRVYDVLIGEG